MASSLDLESLIQRAEELNIKLPSYYFDLSRADKTRTLRGAISRVESGEDAFVSTGSRTKRVEVSQGVKTPPNRKRMKVSEYVQSTLDAHDKSKIEADKYDLEQTRKHIEKTSGKPASIEDAIEHNRRYKELLREVSDGYREQADKEAQSAPEARPDTGLSTKARSHPRSEEFVDAGTVHRMKPGEGLKPVLDDRVEGIWAVADAMRSKKLVRALRKAAKDRKLMVGKEEDPTLVQYFGDAYADSVKQIGQGPRRNDLVVGDDRLEGVSAAGISDFFDIASKVPELKERVYELSPGLRRAGLPTNEDVQSAIKQFHVEGRLEGGNMLRKKGEKYADNPTRRTEKWADPLTKTLPRPMTSGEKAADTKAKRIERRTAIEQEMYDKGERTPSQLRIERTLRGMNTFLPPEEGTGTQKQLPPSERQSRALQSTSKGPSPLEAKIEQGVRKVGRGALAVAKFGARRINWVGVAANLAESMYDTHKDDVDSFFRETMDYFDAMLHHPEVNGGEKARIKDLINTVKERDMGRSRDNAARSIVDAVKNWSEEPEMLDPIDIMYNNAPVNEVDVQPRPQSREEMDANQLERDRKRAADELYGKQQRMPDGTMGYKGSTARA